MTRPGAQRLRSALRAPDASARLTAVLAAGTAGTEDADTIDVLVRRCAVEPDFFVRDMLTWALTRQDRPRTVERVVAELASPVPQARSQALHTLSKLAEPRTWPAITPALLRDEDDEVARAAWRTAAGLAPQAQRPALARELAAQLGRGGRDLQRSLGRAFAELGEAARDVVAAASTSADPAVRTHALAIAHLMADPDADFDAAVAEAQRVVALRGAPTIEQG